MEQFFPKLSNEPPPDQVKPGMGRLDRQQSEQAMQSSPSPRTANLNFGEALHLLKNGHRVTRAGWNGKDMFVFLVQGSEFVVNRPPLLGIYPEGTPIKYRPHLDMRAADGTIGVWLASQTDILADDWVALLDI